LLIAEEFGLSARETEVFLLLAKNKEARAIADELFVSFNTVRTHIKNIYMKLDVHNRRELQDVIDSFAK
ncbi:MAG: helix-turn-helix transcriptional regulator, partial [Eggerthellaceae bacterium]|nr:helix-turn-helix transcriptional regulator [Eggerthellaceae bacterium]